MVIVRSGKKFNVVDCPNQFRPKTFLENVSLEKARNYLAKNGPDSIFSREYNPGYFDHGKYDLWGNEVAPEKKEAVL